MFADTQLARSDSSEIINLETEEGLNGVLHYELILFKWI